MPSSPVYPPPPQIALPRERLMRRLLSTPPGGLCLLTAPAGYGCTSLMAAAAERAGCPVAWVRVNMNDGKRPQRFWRRLVEALAAAGADVTDARAALDEADVTMAGDPATGRRPREEWFEGIESAVLAALSAVGPCLVVVDDLDGRRHQRLAHQLGAFIEAQPASCRMFVRARHGTTLSLAHLLSSGRLVLVDAEALTLDREEAAALVAEVAPEVPEPGRRALVDLAGGWAAGLVSAARVAATDPGEDPAAWLMETGLDLLFSDEVDQLRPEERELLVSTCVLDVLTAAACDAVSGRSDSHVLLARLAGAGVMLSRVEGNPPAYAVHPLFAEHLRHRLQLSGAGAVAQAHRAAADHFQHQGDVDAAVMHLVESGDLREALDLAARNLEPLMRSARAGEIRRMYASVAASGAAESRIHLFGAFWAELVAGNLRGAEQKLLLLDDAVEGNRQQPDSDDDHQALGGPQHLAAEAQFAHAMIAAWQGYPARALEHNARACAYFGQEWAWSSAQAAAFHGIRLRLWQGDLGAARDELVTASRRPRTREHYRSLSIPALSAWLAVGEGRVHRALYLAEDALRGRRGVGAGILAPVQEANARLALADCLTDLDRLDEAVEQARAAWQFAEQSGHVSLQVLALLRLAAVRAARRDAAGTADLLAQARSLTTARCPGSDLTAVIDATEARLCLELGEHGRARQFARRMTQASAVSAADRLLLLARLESEPTVYAALRRAHQIRPETARQKVTLRLHIASCLAASRPDEARAHLLAAGGAAYELGMHRALVAWPEELLVLAERTAAQASSRALTRLLWVTNRPWSAGVAPTEQDQSAAPPVAALSSGELDLLRVLATAPPGAGNLALAAGLGVSVNTLKTRLRRLYAKLGVHTREEALRRAVGAGLVSGDIGMPELPAPDLELSPKS